jgi:hypothetical protein
MWTGSARHSASREERHREADRGRGEVGLLCPHDGADELSEVLKLWRQTTQFGAENDWMFASPAKLGRQPISYTFVWETLGDAAMKAGIGHISSHCFRIPTVRGWIPWELP